MADAETASGGLDPEIAGAPARPEGEEVAANAHDDGGRDCSALADTTSVAGRTNTDGVESTARAPQRSIVRATMRFRVYPDSAELWTELHKFRSAAVRAANVALRARFRADTDLLDAFVAEHGRHPRKGVEWPMPKLNTYQTVRAVAPELSSGGAASTIAREVDGYWRKWRWDTLIWCKRQPPHFRESRAIPLRAAETSVERESGDRWRVWAPIWSGGGGKRALPIRARDARQRQALKALATGEWRLGNASLQYDSRKRRYYVRISYTRLVDALSVTERTAAIQRGIRQFLVVVTHNGREWMDEGHDIVEHRKRTAARRRQIQSSIRTSRRGGRGRKRALRALRALEDKTMRWRDTRTQQLARKAVRWLVDHGVTVLYVEDFTDIRRWCEEHLGERIAPYVHDWRYYDLQSRIVSCAEDMGLHVVQVGAEFISRTCPSCEASVEPDLKRWKLKCGECGYERDMDVAAAHNVRQRGEQSGGVVLVGDKSLGKSSNGNGSNGTARKSGRKGPKSRGRGKNGRKS